MNAVAACCFLGVLCSAYGALQPGSISVSSTTTNRVIQVRVIPPTINLAVKLSQDPTFGQATGVRVAIANLHSNLDFADLNITYPNGVPGGRGLPAGLPSTTNEVRVLFVPVRLAGGPIPPTYATNGWFDRLMFSETLGPDARNVPNSTKFFLEHTTYGRVLISGDIYPEWVIVRGPRAYTSMSWWLIPQVLVQDTVEAIKARQPSFFDNEQYDFIITVMPGELVTVYNNYYEQSSTYWNDPAGYFKGFLNIDLPVQTNSPLLAPITNELNSVSNSFYVRTAYRASRVLGVWLADDPHHTGPNFGGSVNFDQNLITLAAPVPAGSNVIVDYTVATFYRQWQPEAPLFSASQTGSWYGTFLHEFVHALGPHITYTGTEYIFDLYQDADLVERYGLMAGGNHNSKRSAWPLWSDPAYFDAYMKFALGIVHPYELRYGENELNLRLYAAEEFPYTSRTKIIKVPLHPDGFQARRRIGDYDYVGEEFLLVELRKGGPVPGIHNSSVSLPYEGVFIYHVLERNRYTIGGSPNYVRIVDATPWGDLFNYPDPFSKMSSAFFSTAPPFGFASGIFEYTHGAQWQSIGDSNLIFRLEGRGPITIYARFGNGLTNESPATSAALTFDPWPDSDSNDMDDNWETKYFRALQSTQGAPHADPDLDGMSNRAEFLAGTNPTNQDSRLMLSGRFVDGKFRLRVPTTAGARFGLEYSHDLARPRWLSLVGTFSGDGAVHEWTDFQRLVGNRRFFRLVTPEK